jgi:hypothetical protein
MPETDSVTYDAIIAPGGIIRGKTGNMRGQISGQVSGTGMSGEIRLSSCTMMFSARKYPSTIISTSRGTPTVR